MMPDRVTCASVTVAMEQSSRVERESFKIEYILLLKVVRETTMQVYVWQLAKCKS